MKRDVLNVLKCTAKEQQQQVVVVLHGFCEKGKCSNCFSGGPTKDIGGSWVLLTQHWEVGDWGSTHCCG